MSGLEMKIKTEVEIFIHSFTKNWSFDLKSAIEQWGGDA